MSKSKSMSKSSAARIQSVSSKSSKSGNITKGSFAARAQSAADKNSSK